MSSAAAFALDVGRLFVAFLFIQAAVGKLASIGAFRRSLATTFRVPARLAGAVAWAGVVIELAVGAAMVAGGRVGHVGMILALTMLAALTLLLAYRVVVDGVVRCGCFGEGDRAVSGFDLVRNVMVMLCIAFCLGGYRHAADVDGAISIVAVGLAVVMSVVGARFHDICTLLLRPRDELA